MVTINHQMNDAFDPTKKLHPRHTFTAAWLLTSLRQNDEKYQLLHGNKPVKDISAYDISQGKGFISIVLKCTVIFVNSENESYSTILKIPGFDSFIEAQNIQSSDDVEIVTDGLKTQFVTIHQAECAFYNELSKIIDAPIPKIYKTQDWILEEQQEGCIHMEDLTLRGKTLESFDRLNLGQIKSFVRHLARMHKNILSANSGLWKGKYLRGQEALVGYLEHYKLDYGPFFEKCDLKDIFKPLLDKYAKFMVNREYYLYVQKQSYINLNLQPVIVHGDISLGNIMFSINEPDEIAAIIDWQLMHEGSPMSDLAKLLVHYCDGEIRKKAETFIFEYYLECLNEEFRANATANVPLPYTLEQIKKAYYYCFISQAFFAIMGILQNVNTENDENKKAFNDSEILKCLHALEDADGILKGELKEFFDKYNC